MTELKTLKDFDNKKYEQDNCGYGWNIDSLHRDLQKEAIKWIKENKKSSEKWLKQQQKVLPNFVYEYNKEREKYQLDYFERWVKHFFNIKESDLK